MGLYSIRKGKYNFKGYKMQAIYIQIGLFLSCIGLSIYLQSWWISLLAFFIFSSIYSLLASEIISESKGLYFFPSCAYQLSDNYDQINKVFGFSEGFHHWNSARIGWRCMDGKTIELFAYAYVNEEKIIKPLIKCKTDTWIFCTIENNRNEYVFKTVNPKSHSVSIAIEKNKKFSFYSLFKLFIYKLYPRFGGKISAPHDMSMYVTTITLD